ncbi:transcription initiation factor TFIID subunit 5-like [Dromiciops gliroides]|uniref:transcription initiation factor TFIID subunit 5-like n=1 Tax=Dromiciops gliroides TaxID=33562 RepID=UPI001CC5DAE7|nr:transcription initiation factor TFIID subunit 5-like [Dromiciops gliroides]
MAKPQGQRVPSLLRAHLHSHVQCWLPCLSSEGLEELESVQMRAASKGSTSGSCPGGFMYLGEDLGITRKMAASVPDTMTSLVSEEHDNRAATPDSLAESSGTIPCPWTVCSPWVPMDPSPNLSFAIEACLLIQGWKAREQRACHPYTVTGRRQRPQTSAPQGREAWSPESIRILLDVWASPDIQAMRETRKKLRVIYKAIAKRLYKEGVQRCWRQCREMMLALEDLYWCIQEANQKRQGDPIPCPFHEGLERVLPFTQRWHGGPEPEVPDAEPTGYEASGTNEYNSHYQPQDIPSDIGSSENLEDEGADLPRGNSFPDPHLNNMYQEEQAPAPAPAAAEGIAAHDRRTLLAVLQFLRQSNLLESEEILRREAGLLEKEAGAGAPGEVDGLGAKATSTLLSVVSGASPATAGPGAPEPAPATVAGVAVEDQPDVSAVLSAYNQQGDPAMYEEYYSGLKHFIECSLDCHRAELSQLFYPLFVHMYLELVYNQHENEAKSFFEKFHGDQECYYQDDLRMLSSFTKKEHMKGNETLLDFRTSKFVLRVSRDSYQLLKRHLQEKQNNQIWNIVQEHLYIDIFDGRPRSKQQIDAVVGSLPGEAQREANKAKVFFGLLNEPEIEVPLDEDEEGENEEGKPPKKRPKKDSMGSKSKKQDPNAPPQNRIPLPELKDSDKLDKIMNMKETTKRLRLGPDCLPSICFYTFLNAYQGLTAVDIADDSSLIAGGFADSTVRVWSVTPQKLRSLKTATDLSLVDKESDDVLERIMDEKTASESKILHGHSGPVYGASFSPDRNYLLSSSEDGTVRLWSLQTFTCLVGYKGHNYPVWDTQFSPYGYYFVSGGHDRVARLWATDHYQPLRIFVGHLADVNCTRFHPNSNYVATGSADRTVRLWDVSNGNCVRIFTGHKGPIHSLAFSPNGRFLATGATDGRVLLWDIGHGLMVGELKGHTNTVFSLKFSRDGEILASGSMDNTVRLWDAVKAFEDLETHDFTTATGHINLPENSQDLWLGTYTTKSTPVLHLHFTRRNLVLAAGAYSPQ